MRPAYCHNIRNGTRKTQITALGPTEAAFLPPTCLRRDFTGMRGIGAD